MPLIRLFEPADWPAVWPILHEIIAGEDVFAFAPDTPEEEMRRIWVDAVAATFVVEDEAGRVLGTYFLKPNQPGLGAHVCNCGYAVASQARGQGLASLMCEHSQVQALEMGYRAMQFNLVVATNETAVHLWQRHGFASIGRLPGVFRHRTLGYVDAFVMFKPLV